MKIIDFFFSFFAGTASTRFEIGKLPSVRRRNFSDLLEAEALKADAINKLAMAVSCSNDLKREELILREKELAVQEERNGIFKSACATMVDIANAFLNK